MRLERWARISAMCGAMVFGVSVLPIAAQSGEPEPWNQAEVTKLGQQLSEAVTKLRTATLNDPMMRGTQLPGERTAMELRDTLRSLERSCRQLASRLEAGEDREKTLGVARRIGMLIRDAQTTGRRLMTSDSQWAAIDPLVDIINRISPYYGTKSPLLPAVQQR